MVGSYLMGYFNGEQEGFTFPTVQDFKKDCVAGKLYYFTRLQFP